MTLPLVLLGLLSLAGGTFGFPPLAGVLPEGATGEAHGGLLALVTAAVPVLGIVIGGLLFARRERWRHRLESRSGRALRGWLAGGCGFDSVYDTLLVRPFVRVAAAARRDVLDAPFEGLAALSRALHAAIAATQTGRLRWYAMNMAFALALLLLLALGGGG